MFFVFNKSCIAGINGSILFISLILSIRSTLTDFLIGVLFVNKDNKLRINNLS